MKTVLISVCLLFLCAFEAIAQDSISNNGVILPKRYLSEVTMKSNKMQRQVVNRSNKALKQFIKEEEKIKRRLAQVDSLKANNLFANSIDSLERLQSRVKSKVTDYTGTLTQSSDLYIDSLSNSLSFIKDSKRIIEQSKKLTGKVNGSLKSVDILKTKLEIAEQIKTYIRERKQLLKEQLSQYTSFSKNIQRLNKDLYYYAQQLKEYQEVLKDRKKAEQKAMEILNKIPAYNDFLQKHSQLASLFNIQSNSNAVSSLEGLQTRNQVEQLIQQRLGGGGPNTGGPDGGSGMSQQMADARSKFDELKTKFPELDNAGEMPDFKPKEMKTKSLLQRLEFGSNIQFQRSNKFFPTTGELAGQAAYKFHKNGSAGIGLSYKLGMGTGFDNIRFSGQGMGIRSFIDWKLKGTFFLNAGYEKNYQPDYVGIPQEMDQKWTQSGLIGLSKKYKINSKLKGNVMLLFDFLYNRHYPQTDPIKFRLGYNF